MTDEQREAHRGSRLAALERTGAAGGRRGIIAGLKGSGDRKEGQSREGESDGAREHGADWLTGSKGAGGRVGVFDLRSQLAFQCLLYATHSIR